MDIQLARLGSPSGTAYPSLARSPYPHTCRVHMHTVVAVASRAIAPNTWPVGAAEPFQAWPAQAAREGHTGMGSWRTGPSWGPVGRRLLMGSQPRPIACSAFQETSGRRAKDSDPNPCRQRSGDHIHVHNLCSPLGTPSLCAIAQNINIPCRKSISASSSHSSGERFTHVPRRWRWRQGSLEGPGRPMKPRWIGIRPEVNRFSPSTRTSGEPPQQPVMITYDELEALRLVDYQGLTQEEAAQKMMVSRGTVWRCLDSARKKVATMLVEGRELVIGDLRSHPVPGTPIKRA